MGLRRTGWGSDDLARRVSQAHAGMGKGRIDGTLGGDLPAGRGATGGGERSAAAVVDSAAPWFGCVKVSLGRDVDHVLIGARRIDSPGPCRLIAVWTSPCTSRRARPVIAARGQDGAELSRMGPMTAWTLIPGRG